MAAQLPQLDGPSARPIELSFQMPKAPETSIHIHLTINTTSLLLFLAASTSGEASGTASIGSFVYALPDVCFQSRSFYTRSTNPFAEDKLWPDAFNATLCSGVYAGVYYQDGKAPRKEVGEAYLRWKLSQLCQRRYGWYGGGGDGELQKSR